MTFLNKPPLGAQLDFAHPLNKGLVGFWLLNEGHGDKVHDLSMNGNTGTLTNMAFPSTLSSGWNPGRNGVGLQFDGSNDHVNAGNLVNLQINSGTVSAWINTSNAGSGFRGIVVKQYAYGMFLNDNIFMIYDWGAALDRTTGVNLSDGSWHHVAFSFQSGVSNGTLVYIDGVLQLTTIITISSNEYSLGIGSGSSTPVQLFTGLIDEVRIYNRALSAQEIMELYTNPYGMFLPGIMVDIRSNPAGASVTEL